MSGPAASAGASKFQAFMNHPAGAFKCPLYDFSTIKIFTQFPYSVYWLYWSHFHRTPHVALSGPKTVFFWAPMMKWCLVAAGLKDLNRPAEKLSVSQNVGK